MEGIISQTFASGDVADDELVNSIMAAIKKFMMNKEYQKYKALYQ